MSDLQTIPGVGEKIEKLFRDIGVTSTADIKKEALRECTVTFVIRKLLRLTAVYCMCSAVQNIM